MANDVIQRGTRSADVQAVDDRSAGDVKLSGEPDMSGRLQAAIAAQVD